jgi:hypothetical protein
MTTSTQALPDQSGIGGAASGRIDRLATQVHRLRTRVSAGHLDRWLLIAGGVLMPLGIVFILLGWAGASRTPLPFEQNDYLISGGLLGLALVIAGGFTYFAYWQTVRIRESRHQAAELTNAIGRLEALLGGGGSSTAGGSSIGSATKAGRRLVATASGSIFHRPDCPAVIGRDDLSDVDATKTSLRPCRICTPLDPS